MKAGGTILVLTMMSLQTWAQQNSCPVQPILVKNIESQISVSLQNTSGKQVVSYHIGLVFNDVNGGVHAFPQRFGDSITLKSRGRRNAVWHSPQAQQFLFPLAKAYLLDATFSDGTEWVDDGTQSCSVTSVQE